MIILLPVVILLTISFFVLVTISKIDDKSLKIFGWVICVLLWITSALVLATAVTTCCISNSGCWNYAMNRMCPLKGQQNPNYDQYHPWRNNPQRGMMMDSKGDKPMGSSMGSGKCPGMQGMKNMPMPGQEPKQQQQTENK